MFAAVYDAMDVEKPNKADLGPLAEGAGAANAVTGGVSPSQSDTKAATKPDTKSPYNSTPLPDLSNITDPDIRTHELLTAQAPARASVVGVDGKSPTVNTPKSTPVQTVSPKNTFPSIEPTVEELNEIATAAIQQRQPNLPQQPVKPVDPETARLNEIADAAIEQREPNLPKAGGSTPSSVDENSETEYTELTDKELFEQYSTVLQELAPQSFEEFQHIRDTAPERFEKLEDQYRTLSMYKIDSGSMTAKEIWELDQKTFKEKIEKFSTKIRRKGNIASAYINGEVDNAYYAHSHIDVLDDASKYYGSGHLVFLKEDRRFRYVDVDQSNGKVRMNTFYDTEAKLFEHFADLYEQKPFTSITMLSERGMCDSCKGVMEQFKKQFPDVTINVVSNKSVEGNVWGWREE